MALIGSELVQSATSSEIYESDDAQGSENLLTSRGTLQHVRRNGSCAGWEKENNTLLLI